MTLLDAPAYDAAKARLRRNLIIGVLVSIPILAFGTWWFWNWPSEHKVSRFFQAIEAKHMEEAYTIWTNDPDWKKHPEKYKDYGFGRFDVDWGESSDYGVITSHKILMSKQYGSGVVIGVSVNDRKTPLFLWVERKAGTINFSPVELRY